MLNEHKFKKRYGQNFITDVNLLKAIVGDAGVNENDSVLEVGAGAGALTKQIALKAKRVVAFEIDGELKEVLAEELKEHKNVRLVFGDILDYDAKEINSYFAGSFHIIANLPYYITTPLLFFFLENPFNIETMTLMVQREVADRLCAKPGTKDYGALTLTIALKADVKVLRTVSRKMFHPSPNVDSALVQFKIRDKYKIANEELLLKLIKCGFAMRRKTLANNLAKAFEGSGLDKDAAYEILKKAQIDQSIRGESLGIEAYIRLSEIINGDYLI